MAHYFKSLPNFQYVSRLPGAKINDYIEIKNFFRRGKIFEEIFNDLVFFEKYNIKGNERPDNVAQKYYGDSTLDWVIFLSNNIIHVQDEWPLSQKSFDKIMIEKYGSYENLYGGIHYYETSEVTDSRGRILIEAGRRISPTWKTNGNYIETINSKIQSIFIDDIVNIPRRVTVITENEISFLQNGDEVVIENIGEIDYNGTFQINSILSSTSFTYDLPTIPLNIAPTLSDPRKEEVRFLVIEDGPLSSGNAYYFEFYDEGLGYTVPIPSTKFVKPVTNYEYEINKEERKREIFILKPQYLNVLFENLEEVMTYKEGGTQFINRKLKKGDNSKIYNH
jgi:hypothetical protein